MVYPMLSALMIESARVERSLTPEQKAEREVQRKRREELQKSKEIVRKIRANECPDCDGKLDRGKKEKKRDYARKYTCRECTRNFYIGGS